ncbi:MAG: YIP1 family protein [Acidobacteriota bacterium]|nr:YIP1 family protein [Acidobacteriota bacterium]MDH3524343.1 YIP1 family protein [Acidobacteriota bacterium]
MTDSALSRILGVLTAPERTFRAIRERPTWVVAFLVVLAITAGVGQLAQSKVDTERVIRDMLEEAGTVDQARIDEIVARQESRNPVFEGVASTAATALIPLLCALYFWLGTRLFGGEPTFPQSLATVVHAFVPWWALKALLSVPALVSRRELSLEEASRGLLPSNLGFLLADDAPLLLRGVATALDLFTLWGLVLLVLGFAIVARVSRVASAALTLVIWILVLGLTLIPMVLPKLLSG